MRTVIVNRTKRSNSCPYLYQKRGFFYYHFRVPKIFGKNLALEIRFSLQTSYKSVAKKIIAELHFYTLFMIDSWRCEDNLNEKFAELKTCLGIVAAIMGRRNPVMVMQHYQPIQDKRKKGCD